MEQEKINTVEETQTDVSPESIPEHEMAGNWETKIILQRHSRYQGGFPEQGWANPSEKEKETLGHLTPEGIAEAREIASDRIARALKEAGPDVDFAVITSPSVWLDHPDLGQRAVETGEIISEEIRRQLEEANLPSEQLLNITPSLEGESVRQSDKVRETGLFQDMEFTNSLREKYGGQGREFWDAYNEDADREHRKESGVEGAPEAADRVNQLMNVLARWAKMRKIQAPHRKTVIFVVSHHEIIEPFAQRVLGTTHGEFEPQYNDGVEINIDSEGLARTTIAGRVIELSLTEHGLPRSVDADEDK